MLRWQRLTAVAGLLTATACSAGTESSPAQVAVPAAPPELSIAEVEAVPPGGADGTPIGRWQQYFSSVAFDYRYDLVIDRSGSVYAAHYAVRDGHPMEPADTWLTGTLRGDTVTVVSAQGFWTEDSNFRVAPVAPGSTFTLAVLPRGGTSYLRTDGFVKSSKAGTTGAAKAGYDAVDVAWCRAGEDTDQTCRD